MHVQTRPRPSMIGLPLLLLLSACGPFQAGAEAASASTQDPGSRAAATDATDANPTPVWGRLAETDPQRGQAFEIHVSDDDALRLARIGTDGVFRIIAPAAADSILANAPAAAELFPLFGHCPPSAIALQGGDTRVREVYLSAKRVSDGQWFDLVATTSAAYAQWRAGGSQPFEPGAAVLDVYQSAGAVSARGTCVYTSEYDRKYTDTYDLNLVPGLNLVRTGHDRFTASGTDAQVDGWSAGGDADTSIRSVVEFPEGVRWHLLERHAPLPAASDLDWGQLEGNGLEATRLRIHGNAPFDGDQIGPDVVLGETGPDGYFLLTRTEPPPGEYQTTGYFFDCDDIGSSMRYENPEAEILLQLFPGATAEDGSRWKLVSANRPEFARWRGVGGGDVAIGDSEIGIYYATEAVRAEGHACNIHVAVSLSPGWNLVRKTVTAVDGQDDVNGPWADGWHWENIDGMPTEMRWYLLPDPRGDD